MGVRLLSRWARGPMRSVGIDPVKMPARDMRTVDQLLTFMERAL